MNLFKSKFILPAAFLATSLALLTACQPPATEPAPDAPAGTNGKAGYLVGRVTDPQGNPLPRAIIYTENTVYKGRGAEVKTGSDGTYDVQLVKGMGQWTVRGFILKSYNNRVYKIQLDPENPDSFSEDEKPVRNFQWKMTGHIPDLSLDLYYGGSVEMFRDLNADGLYDNENVEFTLKPVGPLLDGSTGKTLKLSANKRYNTIIKDVPIGRYEVTAIYKPTGKPLLVADAWNGDYTYTPSVTLDFLGTESAVRSNSLGIGFTNRN